MYNLQQHKNLTVEKWIRYSKGQQLLMIANELNRAKNWIDKNSPAEVNSSYERALELIDLTTADHRWSRHAKNEIRRLREVLAAQYLASEKDSHINNRLYKLILQTDPDAWNLVYSR